ncbi:MAG TPA: FkbM family methyltransferase [Gaiellaceae bacterium]|nr:FkbM family methyltransferase [Gaiellaceae bacterium]
MRALARRVLPAPLSERLHLAREQLLMRRFAPRVVRHRYGDVELAVSLEDPLAAGWYDADWALPHEIAFLRRGRLGPGARVFDCGAHQGVVALMIAHEVAPGGEVIAVEASPHNAAVLERNRDLNGAAIEVVAAAVTDRPGTVHFRGALNGSITGRGGGAVVPATTLDELTRRFGAPDVVFMDVEGAELQAIAGGAETLTALPDLFVEVHPQGASAEQVLAALPRGYDVFVAPYHGEFVPLAEGREHLAGKCNLVLLAAEPAAQAASEHA